MKAAFALCAFSLAACTTVAEVPCCQPTSPSQAVRDPHYDIAAGILETCDRLGFQRGTGSARLCAMRGIDRYVDSKSLPIAESYSRQPTSQSPACCSPSTPYAQPQVYWTPGGTNYYFR